jgi:uncharacterized phage protein gp47/JayE
MPDVPSFQDLFNIGRDEMLSRNTNLTQTVVETAGTETNIFNASSAAVGDEVIGQLARALAALYLDSANGQDLDRLVFDRYGLVRKPAAPALGSVNFSTATVTSAAFSIPGGTLLQTQGGQQFITITAATFPFGSVGPVTVAVRSTLAGANQQAAIGTITAIVSAITGAPAGITVNNVVATSGAADVETDDSLRARARSFFTTARRGTIGAIQAAALAVPGVVTATAFEVLDAFGRPAKAVNLVVADQFTASLVNITPQPPTYQTQSQTLATQVFQGLADARAAGIFVDVQVGQVVLQGVQLALRFAAGVDIGSVTLQACAAVVGYVNGLAPGAAMTIAGIIGILRAVPGLIVTGNEVVSPPGDVIAEPLQVLRTSLALTLAVAQLPTQQLQSTSNPDAAGNGPI